MADEGDRKAGLDARKKPLLMWLIKDGRATQKHIKIDLYDIAEEYREQGKALNVNQISNHMFGSHGSATNIKGGLCSLPGIHVRPARSKSDDDVNAATYNRTLIWIDLPALLEHIDLNEGVYAKLLPEAQKLYDECIRHRR